MTLQNSCNDDSSWTQELTGEKNNASQLDTGLVTAPGLLSKSQHSVSRKGAMATDRVSKIYKPLDILIGFFPKP